jgi:hypothetical protein
MSPDAVNSVDALSGGFSCTHPLPDEYPLQGRGLEFAYHYLQQN